MFSLKKCILFKVLLAIIFITSNIFAVTATVVPFTYKEEIFEKEYAVKDGIPRLISEELATFKRANISDYDFVIAYFSAEDIVEPYSVLSTNNDRAITFTSNIFQSDYIINGEITDFTLNTNQKENKATVAISVNIIDVKTGLTVTNIKAHGEEKGMSENKVYKTEDAYFSESLLGKATKKAINDLSKNIIEIINSPSPEGIITRIDNGKIYINLGSQDGIKIGNTFQIFKIEKTLMLPEENVTEEDLIITNTFDLSNTHIIENTNDTTNIIAEEPQKIGYSAIRTNSKGDLWYTSETLYRYRFYRNLETYIGEATVIEVFKNYAVLSNIAAENNTEPLMKVKLKNGFLQ